MKRYKVIGTQAFEGHAPGESFNGGLTEGQEQFGLSIGAIKVVSTDVAADQRLSTPTSTKKASPQKKA